MTANYTVRNRTPLYEIQRHAGATFAHLFDWDVAFSFGDLAAEYRAASEGVAILDRSCLGRFHVRGKDALDLLNRLSTNKVDPLPPPGAGAATVLTTPKGRIIDLVHLFSTPDGLLMTTSPQARQRVAEWIDQYTFLEEASLEDITHKTAMVTALGPHAPALLERLTDTPVATLAPYASAPVEVDGVRVTLLRTDPLGSPGYDLVAPAERAESLWAALTEASARPVGEAAFDALRIEAGVPRHGWELSEEVNPWEVDLDRYIHFAKGCYTGQEVVLRLFNYKKVQRRLMRLSLSSPDVPSGALLHAGGKDGGTVTSVARHPVTGETIGLGIVRAAFATEGAALDVVDSQGGRIASATLHELPPRAAVAP